MPKVVVKKHVQDRIDNISRLFEIEKKSSHKFAHLSLQIQLPKLAVMEICGWIEETQDGIVIKALEKAKLGSQEIEEFKKKYISRNYSFALDNFRVMLVSAIGAKKLKDIERKLGADINKLSSKLSDLKKMRDDLSHTLKPSSATVKAPKDLYSDYLIPVYEIFCKYEKMVSKLY